MVKYLVMRGWFAFLLIIIGAASAFASHKLEVKDPADAADIRAQGGRFVADYGSYQLYELDQAPAAKRTIENRDAYNSIELNAGAIDTTQPAVQARRQARGQFKGRQMHMVQFAGPVLPEWYAALQKTGVKILDYVPNNAYVVYGDQAALSQLQKWAAGSSSVQWEGAYQMNDKVHQHARPVDAKGNARDIGTDLFTIQLEDDTDANPGTLALIENLKLAPILRESRFQHFRNLTVKLNPASLDAIAAQPDVFSIQPYFEPRKWDERQDQIIAGNLSGNSPTGPGYLTWLASKGFTQAQFDASGFVVDLSDSGIDNGTTSPGHFGLYVSGNTSSSSRIVYNRLVGTANSGSTLQGCDGHGNINSHIIGAYNNLSNGFPHADSAGYLYDLGVCPFVKIGSSVIFDPSTYTSPNFPNLQSQAYHDGARVSNNSWGNTSGNTYNTDSQSYDALVRDAQPTGSTYPVAGNQEMVIVFAAGNSGPSANTVHPPATAKNVFVIGAAENVRSMSTANGGNNAAGNDGCTTPDTQADSANDIVGFSSRGPCSDGRIKPDICAPGSHITGGAPQTSPPPSNSGTGTALACFAGSGVCGLPGGGTTGNPSNFFPVAQQFYTESSGTSHSTPCVAGACALLRQYFINNSSSPPSAAMTKAYLMNSARYMTGTSANDTLPSNNQGMGELNLGTAFDGVPRFTRDQVASDLFTNSGATRVFVGQIGDSSKPFRVTLAWTDAPGSTSGNAYVNNLDLTVTVGGNTYKGNVFSGSTSVTGGSADAKNNVESVFLAAGVSGVYTVTVTATSIAGDGVPNNGIALDQDFALVVYNATQSATPLSVLPGSGFSSAGNIGGAFSPANQVYALTNSGSSNLNWTVSNSAAWLTLSASSGALAAGAGTNITASINATANSLPAGVYSDTIGFTNTTSGDGNTTRPVTLTVNAIVPVIVADSWTLTAESCLPTNGAIDPGETVTVSFALKNTGNGPASSVVAALLTTGGVTNPSGAQSFGTLPAGGSAVAQPFTFTATGACGGALTATLQIQTNGFNYGTVPCTFTLGQVGGVGVVFTQNFDSVTKPALPAGWTTSSGGGQSLWITTNNVSDTSSNSAFSSDASTVGSNELVSPSISIISGAAKLSFRNNYSLEASSTAGVGYDGGVLEIKIGGGSFQDILAGGGSFVSNGYNRTISSSYSNPLAGRQAWSGSSTGFVTTVVNLPSAAAGQNIQLRWMCGTDSSVGSTGWYIDTISINDSNYVCCVGAAGPGQLVAPGSFDFGTLTTGQSSNTSFNLINTGGSTLTGSVATASPFSIAGGSPYNVSAGQTGVVTVTFTPGSAGTFNTNVIFSGNAGVSTSTVTGVAITPAALGVNPAGFAFGTIATGATAQTTFVVTNSGGATLSGSASVGAPFGIVSGSPFTVAGFGTSNIVVSFSPTFAATYSSNVVFTSNGGNLTNLVSGTGAVVPVALFTATPTNGVVPLLVVFTDNSTGTITNRYWDFGDGVTSNTLLTSLSHQYSSVGSEIARLSVMGPLGSNSVTHLIVVRPVDSVGNGIPDAWRAEYFGGDGSTTNEQSCAACDPDGDGLSNWQEYLAGTDPTNSVSTFAISSLAASGDDLLVTWLAVFGKTYVVQTNGSDNFTTDFADLSEAVVVTGGSGLTTTNYIDLGGATNFPLRFYRVRLVP